MRLCLGWFPIASENMSASVEKAEPDAFEVDEGRQNEASVPLDDTEIYQFLVAYQEGNAGRLVLDPRSVPAEFGERISQQLKLSQDGSKILWPQPTDDPHDPQNVSRRAAIVPDFNVSIGITSVFAMAQQFDTTPNRVKVVWRPHLFAILWYEGVLFGFQIGLHVTNAVIFANPPPNGYGYGQIQIAATYASSR
ncbi:hypothetical protein LXA43DRAFT_980235, partial [Ganoderma leucocontextum]